MGHATSMPSVFSIVGTDFKGQRRDQRGFIKGVEARASLYYILRFMKGENGFEEKLVLGYIA